MWHQKWLPKLCSWNKLEQNFQLHINWIRLDFNSHCESPTYIIFFKLAGNQFYGIMSGFWVKVNNKYCEQLFSASARYSCHTKKVKQANACDFIITIVAMGLAIMIAKHIFAIEIWETSRMNFAVIQGKQKPSPNSCNIWNFILLLCWFSDPKASLVILNPYC